MNEINLPETLADILYGYSIEKNNVGCSSANVYQCRKCNKVLYLKMSKVNDDSRKEHDILCWLADKLPIPEVKFWTEQDALAYLLITEVKGHMACDCPVDEMCMPYEQTIRLLADAILQLQAIPIVNCPFENPLDRKLKEALYNIENNLVDLDDFEEDNQFVEPMELYHWLVQNKPREEELCFTHGDLCLPNIFIDDMKVTGLIDFGRGGVADKWQDIALCVRSIRYNLRHTDYEPYIELLFDHIGIKPNWEKIHYYIKLDELF